MSAETLSSPLAPEHPVESEGAQPARLKMSYAEFLHWADEDMHAEWVDGEVFVQMPPKDQHQRLVEFLERMIALFVDLFDLGIVRIAPFEMRLQEDGPAWRPDIMLLRYEHIDRLTEERLEGAADLVIEAISTVSVYRDRDTKWRAYQAGGVQEYWVIDSRPGRRRADFYRIDDQGSYTLFATEDSEKVDSVALPGFWIKPAWLWAENRPTPMVALYEMAGVADYLIAQMQLALRKRLQP